jgi:catechol 2,3-dioxygenase-like lactoylglutathione lyase family enzyme
MIQGIEHSAISSPDPDSLAAWYVKYLDFTVEDHHAATRNYFIVSKNRSRIEIILAESGLQPIKMKDSGLRHLALITDDFDADYERIKASGVNFLTEPGVRGGNQVVFFQDPEGNVLHLIKRPVPLS